MVKWLVYFDEILPDIDYMKDFIRQNFAKKWLEQTFWNRAHSPE
jgi:hypothetical protein